MFDHTSHNIEGNYVHVGGPEPFSDTNGNVTGRLVSSEFIRMEEDDEEFDCDVILYYYNLAINSSIGSFRFLVSHT